MINVTDLPENITLLSFQENTMSLDSENDINDINTTNYPSPNSCTNHPNIPYSKTPPLSSLINTNNNSNNINPTSINNSSNNINKSNCCLSGPLNHFPHTSSHCVGPLTHCCSSPSSFSSGTLPNHNNNNNIIISSIPQTSLPSSCLSHQNPNSPFPEPPEFCIINHICCEPCLDHQESSHSLDDNCTICDTTFFNSLSLHNNPGPPLKFSPRVSARSNLSSSSLSPFPNIQCDITESSIGNNNNNTLISGIEKNKSKIIFPGQTYPNQSMIQHSSLSSSSSSSASSNGGVAVAINSYDPSSPRNNSKKFPISNFLQSCVDGCDHSSTGDYSCKECQEAMLCHNLERNIYHGCMQKSHCSHSIHNSPIPCDEIVPSNDIYDCSSICSKYENFVDSHCAHPSHSYNGTTNNVNNSNNPTKVDVLGTSNNSHNPLSNSFCSGNSPSQLEKPLYALDNFSLQTAHPQPVTSFPPNSFTTPQPHSSSSSSLSSAAQNSSSNQTISSISQVLNELSASLQPRYSSSRHSVTPHQCSKRRKCISSVCNQNCHHSHFSHSFPTNSSDESCIQSSHERQQQQQHNPHQTHHHHTTFNNNIHTEHHNGSQLSNEVSSLSKRNLMKSSSPLTDFESQTSSLSDGGVGLHGNDQINSSSPPPPPSSSSFSIPALSNIRKRATEHEFENSYSDSSNNHEHGHSNLYYCHWGGECEETGFLNETEFDIHLKSEHLKVPQISEDNSIVVNGINNNNKYNNTNDNTTTTTTDSLSSKFNNTDSKIRSNGIIGNSHEDELTTSNDKNFICNWDSCNLEMTEIDSLLEHIKKDHISSFSKFPHSECHNNYGHSHESDNVNNHNTTSSSTPDMVSKNGNIFDSSSKLNKTLIKNNNNNNSSTSTINNNDNNNQNETNDDQKNSSSISSKSSGNNGNIHSYFSLPSPASTQHPTPTTSTVTNFQCLWENCGFNTDDTGALDSHLIVNHMNPLLPTSSSSSSITNISPEESDSSSTNQSPSNSTLNTNDNNNNNKNNITAVGSLSSSDMSQDTSSSSHCTDVNCTSEKHEHALANGVTMFQCEWNYCKYQSDSLDDFMSHVRRDHVIKSIFHEGSTSSNNNNHNHNNNNNHNSTNNSFLTNSISTPSLLSETKNRIVDNKEANNSKQEIRLLSPTEPLSPRATKENINNNNNNSNNNNNGNSIILPEGVVEHMTKKIIEDERINGKVIINNNNNDDGKSILSFDDEKINNLYLAIKIEEESKAGTMKKKEEEGEEDKENSYDEHVCRWLCQESNDNGDDGHHHNHHHHRHECGKIFKDAASLSDHVIGFHVGSRKNQYLCLWQDCDRHERPFTQRQKIIRHLQTHTKNRPFHCQVCGNSFAEEAVLKQHMRIHSGEKPFECKTCGKKFAASTALSVHLRTHTGEKPLACKWPGCNKRFSESSNLAKHMKSKLISIFFLYIYIFFYFFFFLTFFSNIYFFFLKNIYL